MRIRQSESIGELMAALAKAHTGFGVAVKNRTNTHLKNDYADLSAFIAATAPSLSANQLAMVQTPYTGEDGATYVETMLAHSSGQFKAGDMKVPVSAQKGLNDAQALGSAMTYVMRYARKAMLGIADGYEDDDGVASGEEDERPARREPEERRPPPARTKPAETLNTEVPFADPGESIPEKGTDNGAPWADVVKGARERIATMTSVDEIAKGLSDFETIGVDEIATNAVKRAAVRRMIDVASSVPQLAIAGKLAQATGGSNAWHDETSNLYKTKRAALTTSKTEKAA